MHGFRAIYAWFMARLCMVLGPDSGKRLIKATVGSRDYGVINGMLRSVQLRHAVSIRRLSPGDHSHAGALPVSGTADVPDMVQGQVVPGQCTGTGGTGRVIRLASTPSLLVLLLY